MKSNISTYYCDFIKYISTSLATIVNSSDMKRTFALDSILKIGKKIAFNVENHVYASDLAVAHKSNYQRNVVTPLE